VVSERLSIPIIETTELPSLRRSAALIALERRIPQHAGSACSPAQSAG
jgi:hypothetical protein